MATATKKATTKGKLKHSKAQYMKWYEDMLLMRKFEEKTGQLYIQQKFGGFCHLYIGQEAIVAGTVSATRKGDKHITAYRDHAHPIGLGMHPKVVKMLLELAAPKLIYVSCKPSTQARDFQVLSGTRFELETVVWANRSQCLYLFASCCEDRSLHPS